MRFSMILEMVDKFTGPAKRAKAGVGGLRASVRQMAGQIRGAAADVDSGARSIEHFDRRARRLRQVALGRTFQAIGNDARKLGRDLFALERRLKLVERSGALAGRGLKSLARNAAGLLKSGLLAGGAAVAGAGGFALFDLFSTAGQFEQYQAMLEGTEGSVSAARKSMAWVTKFAEKTPYELSEVMEAFVQLKAYGIDPMNGSLAALGDASSGMSKPLMDAVEAIADASTGEFERLKSFSIRARKEGDRTTFSYVKNGKEITRVAKGQGAAIQEALVGIFNERFAGSMVRQSTTLFGIIANIKDKWAQFLLLIANAGIFDMVKDDLQALLERVDELAKSGELQRWAEEISNRLKQAWQWGKEFVENTDWDKVVQDMKDIAAAVGLIADGVLALRDAYNAVQGLQAIASPLQNPVLKAGFRHLTGQKPAGATGAGATPRAPARLPSDASPLRQFQKQSSLTVGGKSVVEITTAPGLAARVQSVSAKGSAVPLEVRTGRTMRSAA